MDGLLVIDKPSGPTSHDVVARVRRLLHERSIGHTGTLDPMATGVLPLVIGRATRLARFLSAADKTYEATVQLGVTTDSGDRQGRPTGTPHPGPFPAHDEVDRALDQFRGTFLQQPPAISAKRVGGRRSYRLARQAPVPGALPAPVSVTAHAVAVLGVEADIVRLRIDCASGFYVRALASDLGERLGTGAHLSALRRTRSGHLTLADAISLDGIEADEDRREGVVAAIIPLAEMLPDVPCLSLTDEGARRARVGRDLGASDFDGGLPPMNVPGVDGCHRFRLLDRRGNLVGLAEPSSTPGLLHPAVVLV